MALNRRKIKFAIIQKLLMPVGVVILRTLFFTCRVSAKGPETLEAIVAEHPRLIVVNTHGMSLGSLGIWTKCKECGRSAYVMTSPSRDGIVMDKIISYFAISSVKGSSRSRGSAAAIEMIRAVQRGGLGFIALDGPRGPLFVPKPGVLTIAEQAEADVYTMAVSANWSIKLRTWDRLFIPLPFSRIDFTLRRFPIEQSEERATVLERLYRQLLADSRAIGSPCAVGVPDTLEGDPKR